MKIGIDVRSLHIFNKTRGIGFYTQNLFDSLKKYTNHDVVLVEKEEQFKDLDLIHFPNFDFFRRTLKIVPGVKNVVTIHDVIPLMYPKHYPPGIKGRINLFLQKKQLKKIDIVATVSNVAKKGIVRYLGVPEKKIQVIHLAPAPHFKKITDKKVLEKVTQKYDLPKKFVLFTGNVNWNKNILNLTEAALDAELDIVMVGSSFEQKNNLDHPELKSYAQFLKRFKNNSLVHTVGFVPNEDLVGIYNQASLLLMPSFAEGFGLPILEAQICGVPVITSNCSSMVEVAGEGAVLVDPDSVLQISAAIKRIVEDSEFKEKLVKKGLENVMKYSWEKVARGTLEVYTRLNS